MRMRGVEDLSGPQPRESAVPKLSVMCHISKITKTASRTCGRVPSPRYKNARYILVPTDRFRERSPENPLEITMSLPALTQRDIITFILKRYGVDLSDYLASPEIPMHACACVAESIARAALIAESQRTELITRARSSLGTARPAVTIAYLCDAEFKEGSGHAYDEALRMAMKPLLPKPEPKTQPVTQS